MITLIAIIFSILPGFAWLFFYLKEDLHPEPKKLIALTFFMGLVSAMVALVVERIVNIGISPTFLELLAPLTNWQFIYLLALAFVEEIVKFGAAYFSVHKNPEFDEPVDAMIYMIIAALGFATLENLGAISQGIGNKTALLDTLLTTASLRFIGATLLHSLTSGLLGYYWAVGIREMNVKKFVIYGLIVAASLHAIFNGLIVNYGNIVYLVVFLMGIACFVLNDFEKLKRRFV